MTIEKAPLLTLKDCMELYNENLYNPDYDLFDYIDYIDDCINCSYGDCDE